MKKRIVWSAAGVALLLAGALAFGIIRSRADRLPDYIVTANGRLEVGRIDIATKYAGRLQALLVQEGESVAQAAVIAHMDTAELQTQRAAAQAVGERAAQAVLRAQAQAQTYQSRERLAQLELKNTMALRKEALVSQVELQRRRLAQEVEAAGLAAAQAAAGEARAALAEAEAQIQRIRTVLDEMTLRAPVSGRIEYRVSENGAVLPAGGRVATLLNTADVYMTLFLPAQAAAQLRIGQAARVVLDGLGAYVFPAKVVFVAAQAQFTPKYVETASEREKLMYRVKLQLPSEVALQYAPYIKAGMTGNGYLSFSPQASWPANLTLALPKG